MLNNQSSTNDNEQWVQQTVQDLEAKGYRLVPHYPNNKPYPFGHGEFYPAEDKAWQKSPLVSIALDDYVLLDYDGNKSDEIISTHELAKRLGVTEETLMSNCVQTNDKGDSLHFIYRRGMSLDNLSHSNATWEHFIDIKTGNQLMHIKPGKTLTMPSPSELNAAPQPLIHALWKGRPNPPLTAANDEHHNYFDWLENIENDEQWHDSSLLFSAYLISKSVNPLTVTKILQHLFKGRKADQVTSEQKKRFEARYNDIPRLVQGAIDKGFGREVFTQPGFLKVGWLDEYIPPPKILVDDLIPASAFGVVGAGGAAKTSIMLKVMIHIILGKPLWGRHINSPGKCLFISAEDSLDLITHRIQKICHSMGLSDKDKRQVEQSLSIHDVSGQVLRFVEVDGSGNLIQTRHVDDIINLYAGKDFQFACFDPTVFFGPGERFINDAEAALMQCARRISKGLGDIATCYIHHMSKQGASEKHTTAHAGRGGSAFGDNSRAIWVVHPFNPDDKNKPTPPYEITQEAKDDGRVIYVSIAKFSFAKRIKDPLWVVRDEHNGFDMTFIDTQQQTTEERQKEALSRNQSYYSESMLTIFNVINDAHSRSQSFNKSLLRDKVGLYPELINISKHQAENLVDELKRLGFIEGFALNGKGRKSYLKPTPIGLKHFKNANSETNENE